MQTNQLKRIHPNRKRMIVARGGKRGKTAGRGGKGQSARAGNKRRPEWRDIIKRIPKLRGRGINPQKPVSTKPVIVNLSIIETVFSANDAVNPKTMIEKGVISTISGVIPTVKILGDGEITKVIKISDCAISESAKSKIEKAGGSVTFLSGAAVAKEEKRKLGVKNNTLKDNQSDDRVASAKKSVEKKEKIEKTEKIVAAKSAKVNVKVKVKKS